MRAGLEAEGTRGQWGLGSFPSINFGARSCLEAWRQILTILQLAVGPWTNQVKWELKTRAFESVLSDVKEWEGWTHTTTWMDFRTVTECERSQPPKSMWGRSPFLRRSRTGKTNRWWNKDENHGCLWGRAGMDGLDGEGAWGNHLGDGNGLNLDRALIHTGQCICQNSANGTLKIWTFHCM